MATGEQGPHNPGEGDAGRGGHPEDPAGSDFAQVFDSFTFDSGWRKRRKKKRGKREPDEDHSSAQQGGAGDVGFEPLPAPQTPAEDAATVVRPYTWTQGRTRSEFALELETLVSSAASVQLHLGQLQEEHQAILRLCDQPRSVAEIAALVSVPLGVARVLIGDMARLELLHIHQTSAPELDNVPNLNLMERVLAGLRNL